MHKVPVVVDSGCTQSVAHPLSAVAVSSSAAAVSAAAPVYWPASPCASEPHQFSAAAVLPLPPAGVCIESPCLRSWCEQPHDPSSPTQSLPCTSQPTHHHKKKRTLYKTVHLYIYNMYMMRRYIHVHVHVHARTYTCVCLLEVL